LDNCMLFFLSFFFWKKNGRKKMCKLTDNFKWFQVS
jgi:hypothetical protein